MDFGLLSHVDDLLAEVFLDQLHLWFSTMKVSRERISLAIPKEQVLAILQERVIRGHGQIREAVIDLSKLPCFADLLQRLNTSQRDEFLVHLKRYILMFAPNAGYEITGTGRYAALGTKVQACVSATRDWKAGEEIRFCTGVIACLTSEQEELMSKENRDFSIMYSTRKSSPCLFLGPARFMNHDCGSNCRFMPYGENGITFKVVKDIACGEEITTFYGAHYFGEDNCECWCATCEVEGRGHFAAEPRGPIVLKATTNASSRRRSSRKRKQQSYEEFFAKVKRRRKLQSYEDADSVAEESLPARNSKKENLPTSGDVDTHAQQRPSCGTTYHHGALPNYASLHGPPPPVAYHNANLEPYEHQPISFDSNVNLPSGVCSASNAPYGYQRMPQAYTDEPHNMLWNMEDFQYEYPVKMRQYHKAHPRSLFCHMCSPSEQRRQLYATQLQQNCTYSAAYVNCDNNVSSLSDRTNPSAYPYRSFMDMLDPNQPPYLEERMSSNLSHASFNPSPEFYATVHNPYDAYYELPGPAVNSGFMNSAVSSVTIGANHTLASLSPSAFSLSPHTMSETTTYALSSDSEDNGSCHVCDEPIDGDDNSKRCRRCQRHWILFQLEWPARRIKKKRGRGAAASNKALVESIPSASIRADPTTLVSGQSIPIPS